MKIQIPANAYWFVQRAIANQVVTIAESKNRIAKGKKKYHSSVVARMQKTLAKREKKLKILKASLKKLTIVKV